jgi:signal peptidase I
MGDNRNNSADSRIFGPISLDKVFGKVIFIYGPFSRIGTPE